MSTYCLFNLPISKCKACQRYRDQLIQEIEESDGIEEFLATHRLQVFLGGQPDES